MLVTFAVTEESRPFQRRLPKRGDVVVLVTGIGKRNAKRALQSLLTTEPPECVLTCGFAGGLAPDLPAGTVVLSADAGFSLTPVLLDAGARPAQFHCADRIAATVEEKRALRQRTGADAVEMESGVLRALCLEQGIPSATVRVISDSADEDLPLDFNRFIDRDDNLSYGKLALALAVAPAKIGALIRFQKQLRAAADKLAEVLVAAISARGQARP